MIPLQARQKQRVQEAVQAAVHSKFVPAPIGGLNSQDSLATMPPTDAILLENLFPQTGGVTYRPMAQGLYTCTGLTESLMAYNALNGSNLVYAAVSGVGSGKSAIYRVDALAGGAVGAPVVGGTGNTVTTLINAQMDWTQFGTGALEVLIVTNLNADNLPLIYDGTSWTTQAASGGTYPLSAGPSGGNNLLTQVVRYKSRLWYLQGGTFNVFYLPQNVVSGALTPLALGPLFTLGGSIAAMVAVSIDNAAGINDFMAFISTQGEVVMMQGYDPASVSTWSEAGHFFMAKPLGLGRRTWVKMGSDALILCTDGVVPLSAELLTDRLQPGVARTAKVRSLMNNLVLAAGTTFGQQLVYWPEYTALIAQMNQTAIEGDGCPQLVQNVQTNAWAKWNDANTTGDNWGAVCWELCNGFAYFGYSGGGSLLKAPPQVQGSIDVIAGANKSVKYQYQTAYSLLDAPEHIKMMSGVLLHTANGFGAIASYQAQFVFDYAMLTVGFTPPYTLTPPAVPPAVLRAGLNGKGRAVSLFWSWAPANNTNTGVASQLVGFTYQFTAGSELYG